MPGILAINDIIWVKNVEIMEAVMGIFRLLRRPRRVELNPERELFGWEQAGRYCDHYTSKYPADFLKGVLTGWFQWSENEAERKIRQLLSDEKLVEESLKNQGVELQNADGSQVYKFVLSRAGVWDVTRLKPEE